MRGWSIHMIATLRFAPGRKDPSQMSGVVRGVKESIQHTTFISSSPTHPATLPFPRRPSCDRQYRYSTYLGSYHTFASLDETRSRASIWLPRASHT